MANINEEQYNLIEKHLRGELTEREGIEFEGLLQNSQFTEALELETKIYEAVVLSERNLILEQLNAIHMEQEDIEGGWYNLIEKHLREELSLEEEGVFNQLLKNSNFLEIYNQEKKIFEAVKLNERNDIAAKINAFHEAADPVPVGGTILGINRRKFLLVAAAVLFLLVSPFIYNIIFQEPVNGSSVVTLASVLDVEFKGNEELFPADQTKVSVKVIPYEEKKFDFDNTKNELTLFLENEDIKEIEEDFSSDVKFFRFIDSDITKNFLQIAGVVYSLTQNRSISVDVEWDNVKEIDENTKKAIEGYPSLNSASESDLELLK